MIAGPLPDTSNAIGVPSFEMTVLNSVSFLVNHILFHAQASFKWT
jgi:hypothetical protein